MPHRAHLRDGARPERIVPVHEPGELSCRGNPPRAREERTWAGAVALLVAGGVLELGLLYLFFSVVLEALRTRRSLGREPLLWLGLGFGLLPPAYHFLLQVAGG